MRVGLMIFTKTPPAPDSRLSMMDLSDEPYAGKPKLLRVGTLDAVRQQSLVESPSSRIMPPVISGTATLLSQVATSDGGNFNGRQCTLRARILGAT